LLFFGFLLFLGLFVFVAPVVHYLTDRRNGIRRNFYQIKSKFSRCLQGVFNRYNSQLVALRIDYPNFACANVSVNVNTIRSIRVKCPFWLSYASTSL
jgi:hypothetical protein